MHFSLPGTTIAWIGDGLGNNSNPEFGHSSFNVSIPKETSSRNNRTSRKTLLRRLSPTLPIIDSYDCWMVIIECDGSAVEYTNGLA
jgi:hypothetical protein